MTQNKPPYVRQAVVVIHGMGDQLPLSTLTRFIDTALVPDASGDRVYYSRPETVTGSFESRRFLAPRRVDDQGAELRAQTDIYEYHWADKMQGNRLDDLWPTTRRILLQWPTRVPGGLRVVWVLAWITILASAWTVSFGALEGKVLGSDAPLVAAIEALVSGGLATAAVSYLLTRTGPDWLTTSFVDVVRYLDTSPRSFAARRDIRKGIVDMLTALHDSRDYDRIVIVAHSLGAYIAYDAIAYLWGTVNYRTDMGTDDTRVESLAELQSAAEALPADLPRGDRAEPAHLARYQAAQRKVWAEVRSQGNPWLITDFVSVGTPMYFADHLLAGKDGRHFRARIRRRELPTCPPQPDAGEYLLPVDGHDDPDRQPLAAAKDDRWLSYDKTWTVREPDGTRRRVRQEVVYEGAPFAVVRWTNIYFPVRYGLFGDWFGGPLAPLFGYGVHDVPVTGNTLSKPGTHPFRHRHMPGAAHSYYFSFPDDATAGSVASRVRDGLDLASSTWADVERAPRSAPPSVSQPASKRRPRRRADAAPRSPAVSRRQRRKVPPPRP